MVCGARDFVSLVRSSISLKFSLVEREISHQAHKEHEEHKEGRLTDFHDFPVSSLASRSSGCAIANESDFFHNHKLQAECVHSAFFSQPQQRNLVCHPR
jgi:hypothetical protein